jgi:inosose dehydratase
MTSVVPARPPVKLATGPVTWGVDFADTPGNPPWAKVLDDIEASGIGALELGPIGYLPEDPVVLRAELDRRDLHAVGSFVFEDLHDPTKADAILALAERACRAVLAGGGDLLVMIDRVCPERVATAGRPGVAPRLDGPRWAAMLELIGRVAAVARSHGVRPVFHPHAGGYVEFEDEIERLLADTDLELCVDTGHSAYARVDPVALLRRVGSRVGHVHFKDIRPSVLAQVDAEALDFWQAIERGIFCPVGEGMVDIAAVLGVLAELGYEGYATIEQDRVPGQGTPLDDLRRSMAVIAGAMA